MLLSIPELEDYGLSPTTGFLPDTIPVQRLTNSYYRPWEAIMEKLQALLLSGRLHEAVDNLPMLTVSHLHTLEEYRRAFMVLGFIGHAYVWGGEGPCDTLPKVVAVPWEAVAKELDLKPVINHAALCLWNFSALVDAPVEELTLSNLATNNTFTGSLDESWFYLISTRIEILGGPCLPLILDLIRAARENDTLIFIRRLRRLAAHLSAICDVLARMHERCDPYVFYHKIRPFLAGWNNMSEAGLPKGVRYMGCSNSTDEAFAGGYRLYAGGSNAQSALIQVLDIALGVEHRPTGSTTAPTNPASEGSSPPAKQHNFIREMRQYMPGEHRRFIEHLASVANVRQYVESIGKKELTQSDTAAVQDAYDACVAMLRRFRDLHLQIVSRFIIVPANAKKQQLSRTQSQQDRGIATVEAKNKKEIRGTGGTFLMPFLKQARDETIEMAAGEFARGLIAKGFSGQPVRTLDRDALLSTQQENQPVDFVGLAGNWSCDGLDGGICHW